MRKMCFVTHHYYCIWIILNMPRIVLHNWSLTKFLYGSYCTISKLNEWNVVSVYYMSYDSRRLLKSQRFSRGKMTRASGKYRYNPVHTITVLTDVKSLGSFLFNTDPICSEYFNLSENDITIKMGSRRTTFNYVRKISCSTITDSTKFN